MMENINQIHDSFLNGQISQMVRQINEYGRNDFFSDYAQFLQNYSPFAGFEYYTKVTIYYHRTNTKFNNG